ncbi:MAG: hypothetical protein CM15mP85_12980 [Rhodobacterales bacterium]|nr:MAG: hypothetical protein CM15mP85_12980 [Rhodobacterales bacterium]
MHIEALKLPGKGRMKTTGKLGDVMKESIDAANSYVRSISTEVGIKPPKFDKTDIHVHVPEGPRQKMDQVLVWQWLLNRIGSNRYTR